MAEIGVAEPDNVVYVPIDFESSLLSERLLAKGYDTNAPAVFAWTGVTQYIPEEAINKTLNQVLSIACSGSALAVQITLPKHLVDDHNKAAIDFFMKVSAERGEPWVNAHDPSEVAERLRHFGFARVEICLPDEAQERFVGTRADGLHVGGYFAMLTGHVG